MKKTFLSFLAALAIFASFMPISHADPIQNADGSYSGNCDNFSGSSQTAVWTINMNARTLKVDGNGAGFALITDVADGIFSLPVPSGNTSWGASADYVDTITFSEGLTDVSGFYMFTNASKINFPNSLTSIGSNYSWNFRNNDAISNLVIPANVTSINGEAFTSCSSLKTVHLPKGIKTISNEAFYASPVKDVYYAGTQADWNAVNGAFPSAIKNAAIHYSDSTVSPPAPEHDFWTTSAASTTFHVPLPSLGSNAGKSTLRTVYIIVTDKNDVMKGRGNASIQDLTADKIDVTVDCPLNVGDKIWIRKIDW